MRHEEPERLFILPHATPRTNRRALALRLLVGACVLAAGALEARFGRPELLGDDISYLDVANAIHSHDWRAALNPLWSIGYPALLTCFKPFFASTVRGELNAVFALNIVIYLATWLSFLLFLHTAATFRVPHLNRLHRLRWGLASGPITLIPAACIFLCTQLCFSRVSSIGPDELARERSPRHRHQSALAGKVLHENWPFTLAILLCAIFQMKPSILKMRPSFWLSQTLRSVFSEHLKSFPVWLPSLLAIALYLQVHLEGRYIAPFLAILAVTVGCRMLRRRLITILLLAGTLLTLYPQLKPAHPSTQWQIADYLTQSGLNPGDKVASVSTLNDIRCTWAYAARLHIVDDIGNDAYTPQDQQQDFTLFRTNPAIQSDVLRLFREQGAVAVIVPHAPSTGLTPEWQPIPQTDAFLLRL